jgi:putative oxidoreductase
MNSMFTKIARIALGLMLLIFGANKFLHFIHLPPPTEDAAKDFLSSLEATGYIFPIVGILEVIIGLLLLTKKWVPFSLILLFPITLNILLFHLFLEIPGMLFAILIIVFNTILIYKYWEKFKPLFN